jgi:hypothetical protein
LSSEEAIVSLDKLRQRVPDTANVITSLLGEERSRLLVAELKKHQERIV